MSGTKRRSWARPWQRYAFSLHLSASSRQVKILFLVWDWLCRYLGQKNANSRAWRRNTVTFRISKDCTEWKYVWKSCRGNGCFNEHRKCGHFWEYFLAQLFDVICQECSCLAVHSLSWSTAYIFFRSWERNVLWHPSLFGLHPSGTISGIAAPHVGVMFHVWR